jgi:hypothetical protein
MLGRKIKHVELKVVGYWKPFPRAPIAEFMGGPGQPESEFPDPKDLVDETWKERCPDLYEAVCKHLIMGDEYNAYKGSSICRICGCNNGSEEFTDGTYYWPSGYLHYITEHGVVPPNDFLEHVLKLFKGVNMKIMDLHLDGETAERFEKMSNDFGFESPNDFLRFLINHQWEKAKEQGKIGDA